MRADSALRMPEQSRCFTVAQWAGVVRRVASFSQCSLSD